MLTKRDAFLTIMDVANEIVEHDPRGLVQFVRLCGTPAFARFLSWRLRNRSEKVPHRTCPEYLLFPPRTPIGPEGQDFWSLCPERAERRNVSLAKTLVMPWPWNRKRLAQNLASIGVDREWGKWKHDVDNHFAELWLPLGIVWVSNGNHSITTGIIRGEGRLRVDTVRDIRNLYHHINCDGETFSRVHDGSTIGPVRDVEFAAIFEAGRLMVQYNVCA